MLVNQVKGTKFDSSHGNTASKKLIVRTCAYNLSTVQADTVASLTLQRPPTSPTQQPPVQ